MAHGNGIYKRSYADTTSFEALNPSELHVSSEDNLLEDGVDDTGIAEETDLSRVAAGFAEDLETLVQEGFDSTPLMDDPPQRNNENEYEDVDMVIMGASTSPLANFKRICELEYKWSRLNAAQKPLPERAQIKALQIQDELTRRVDQELDLMHTAYGAWVDFHAEPGQYRSLNQARKNVEPVYEELGQRFSLSLPEKIRLMHLAITTAHAAGPMAEYIYGIAEGDAWSKLPTSTRKTLDILADLSNDQTQHEAWDQEIHKLLSMPRGADLLVRAMPMKQPRDLTESQHIEIERDGPDGNNQQDLVEICLYDKTHRAKDGLIGTIQIMQDSPDKSYEVRFSSSIQPGFGPLLYDLALEVAYKFGATGLHSDRTNTSTYANNVWKHYHDKRQDVTKTPTTNRLTGKNRKRYGPETHPEMFHSYSKQSTPLLDELEALGKVKYV